MKCSGVSWLQCKIRTEIIRIIYAISKLPLHWELGQHCIESVSRKGQTLQAQSDRREMKVERQRYKTGAIIPELCNLWTGVATANWGGCAAGDLLRSRADFGFKPELALCSFLLFRRLQPWQSAWYPGLWDQSTTHFLATKLFAFRVWVSFNLERLLGKRKQDWSKRSQGWAEQVKS